MNVVAIALLLSETYAQNPPQQTPNLFRQTNLPHANRWYTLPVAKINRPST